MAILLTLEEPYRIIIYRGKARRRVCIEPTLCLVLPVSTYTDWRLIDKRGRFVKRPETLYFTCSKKGETRNKQGLKTEIEVQITCRIDYEDIRDMSLKALWRQLNNLTHKCETCHLALLLPPELFNYYTVFSQSITSVGMSYTLRQPCTYVYIRDRYGERGDGTCETVEKCLEVA